MDSTNSKKISADKSANLSRVIPALDVEQLFAGFRELRILHGCEEYKLTLTRNNKLILTK